MVRPIKSISLIILGIALSITGNTQNWISLNSGTTVNLHSICFTDTNTGYAVGASGTILKTIDGGTQWVAQNSGTSSSLTSVRFCNADSGYIAGYDGVLLKTTDGGLNWIHQDFDTIDHLWDIQYLSPDTILINTGPSILKTMDGGMNWTTITMPEPGNLWACNSNIIYMVCGAGDFYSTTDGGDNWVLQLYIPMPGGGIFDICFSNTSLGIAVGGGYSQGIYYEELFYTRDGGNPWARSTYSSDKWYYSVFFTDDTTAYAVGSDGAIIKTTDTGEHYTELSSGTSNNLNAINFVNSITGYIAGDNGTILKTYDGPIGTPESISAVDFVQIYPNPFKDNLNIEFKKDCVFNQSTVAVYNLRGQKLLEKEILDPQTRLDIQTLMPGVYFMKIISPESNFQIKLIKE